MDKIPLFVSTRNLVVKSILPKYVKRYMKKQYYPVVIGGYDVLRCVKSKLPIEFTYTDVDMPFVVVPRPSNPSVTKDVIKARNQLLTDIVTDEQLKEHTSRHDVMLAIDKSKSTTHIVRLVQLVLEFKDGERLVLMDLPIWASDSIYHLGMYETFFPDHTDKMRLRHPVPLYMHNGVPYATCRYLYYDTTRMLSYYKDKYEESSTQDEKHHSFQKLLRYGLKYIALYREMYKANNRQMLQVFAGFEHLLHLTKSDKGMKAEYKLIYDRIMYKLGRLHMRKTAGIK